MRIAYLDCFSGISGDMFLGALVDAGVPARLFEDTVAALNLGARLEISRVDRGGISATKVDVYVHGEKDLPRDAYLEGAAHMHKPGHEHSAVSHSHSREHVQLREHNYARGSQDDSRAEASAQRENSRGLKEIREIIRKSGY